MINIFLFIFRILPSHQNLDFDINFESSDEEGDIRMDRVSRRVTPRGAGVMPVPVFDGVSTVPASDCLNVYLRVRLLVPYSAVHWLLRSTIRPPPGVRPLILKSGTNEGVCSAISM